MSENNVLIIGEAGVNHNGSIEIAKQLINVAAEAGVDYVKFQTFKTEKIVSKKAKKAEYQKNNLGDNDGGQYGMLKKLELDKSAHETLIAYCNEKNVKFLSTPFDLDSIDLLCDLNIEMFKIPSGEITNLPYLKKIASKGKKTLLSTGMSNLGEIEKALNILCNNGLKRNQITVLHCNTEYPTPLEDVNLKAMNTISDALKVKVGYSDHTLGIEVAIAAVSRNASCIEKHFTLDRNMEGPDHGASLEPDELKQMVRSIRNIEKALGNGIKSPSQSEKKNIVIARKSIHLNKSLSIGDILSEKDLIMKRPGDGISPMDLHLVVGKKMIKNLDADAKLNFKDFN